MLIEQWLSNAAVHLISAAEEDGRLGGMIERQLNI